MTERLTALAFVNMGMLNSGTSIMGIVCDQMIKGLVRRAAVNFDVHNKKKKG